jgi:hypothetical protein
MINYQFPTEDDSLAFEMENLAETLGKEVRQVWVDFQTEQWQLTGVKPKASHLDSWEKLNEADKEVDRRIGQKLFFRGYNESLKKISALESEVKELKRQNALLKMQLNPALLDNLHG